MARWVFGLALTALSAPTNARAQACCAGGSAVTPGRLELHEDALVGIQTRVATVFGSFNQNGRYFASPAGDSEYDFEEDVFCAMRVLRRGQVALLVPLVETSRATPSEGSRIGAGVGDVNLSARYDFYAAGQSRYLPGVALLGGVTFPTGTPVESTRRDVDATGVGAFQANVALALEQTFGRWLVNATGVVAARTPRFGETLAPQVTLFSAGAYTLANDAAVAISISYALEGDAAAANGQHIPQTAKRLFTVSASALWPINDAWRLLGGLFLTPPFDRLGSNQLVSAGCTITVVRSWS
jgi:hypothetical protein